MDQGATSNKCQIGRNDRGTSIGKSVGGNAESIERKSMWTRAIAFTVYHLDASTTYRAALLSILIASKWDFLMEFDTWKQTADATHSL